MESLIKKSLIFFLVFLVGCSSTTFVYNRIDFLLPWYLESYVDLNREQKQDLKQLLIPFFKWHREEELPNYLAIIEDLELALDASVEFETIAGITYDVEESWFRLEDRMLLWAIPMTRELSSKQLDGFIQSMQTKTEQSEKEYLNRNLQTYQNDNYKRLRKNLRRFMGGLNKEQLGLVSAASKEMIRVDGQWIANRKALIEKLKGILEREDGWELALENISHRDDLVAQNYRKTYAHNISVNQNLLVEILNSRTDKQDLKLRTQLLKYKTDINNLINQK
jgi:hypothetical protein|tara:strand:+ start:585 stop:1421 length:837 start_codon:yes stop_codon:yes gene_type:complete